MISKPNNTITAIYLGSQFFAKRNMPIPSFLKKWHEDGMLFYMQLLSDEYKLEPKDDFNSSWFDKT